MASTSSTATTAAAAANLADASSGAAGKPAAVPAVLVGAPKPKPTSVWKLYHTDDGEDYYYFNDQTGDSIWELPESEIQT